MKSNWIKFPAAVLAAVVALAIILWMNRECSAEGGQQAIRTMNAMGCADYWFGRYQLLAGLLLLLPAALSIKRLLARHLSVAVRDRALMVQEVWIRRSRELLSAAALAAETVRTGAEIAGAAPKVAKADSTQDIDAHADTANGWLMRLSVLEGKADEAFAGSVGGPEVSEAFRALAATISEVRRRMSHQLQILSVSTPPRRYAGSSVVEGQEVFISVAKEFEAGGREIAQAGETMRKQIDEERSRLQQLLRGLDRRVFG
ncbi:MAG TPA: hypothetical protein VGU45_16715 [Microvirga sp.]|jgi:hypothetical protein|nr:hypothetical protein [Microvirga sp.]